MMYTYRTDYSFNFVDFVGWRSLYSSISGIRSWTRTRSCASTVVRLLQLACKSSLSSLLNSESILSWTVGLEVLLHLLTSNMDASGHVCQHAHHHRTHGALAFRPALTTTRLRPTNRLGSEGCGGRIAGHDLAQWHGQELRRRSRWAGQAAVNGGVD